jgi:hypothetical protein
MFKEQNPTAFQLNIKEDKNNGEIFFFFCDCFKNESRHLGKAGSKHGFAYCIEQINTEIDSKN